MRPSSIPILVALIACAMAPGRGHAQAIDPWAVMRDTADPVDPSLPGDLGGAVALGQSGDLDGAGPDGDLIALPLRRTSPEIDPYEPLGIRAGSFILYPSLEATAGYTTNGTGAADGPESGFGSLTPELVIRSDWGRHEATLSMRGTYETFTDGSIDDQPSATVEGTARIDFAEGWALDHVASYDFYEQSISDPNYPAGVDNPPGVHEFASLSELRGNLGRNVLAFGAILNRTVYENGTSGGVVVDQSDRDNTEVGGRLRYGFEATPLVTPFVEGDIKRRIYDQKVDDEGIERSSWIYGLRGGLAYKSDPVLSGEIAIGYALEEIDDPSLSGLGALTFDGSLTWSPTELTTVTFDGATSLSPTTDPDSSGSVVYEALLDLAYRWRENVTLDTLAGLTYERFEGTGEVDTTYQLGVGATWRLNRSLHLRGGYVHEWLESSDAASDYTSDTVEFTLRLQR
jgi:hypothetical protein